MSHKSFSDIIEDTLHIDFSLSFGDPPSASNPMSKIRLKSPPHTRMVSSEMSVLSRI